MIYNMEIWLLSVVLGLMAVVVGWVLWRWNDILYVRPIQTRYSKFDAKVPPGHMGFPLFGETLSLLWFFNFCGRPDDFISSKQNRYGINEGIYRTHLYGSPSIIACSPTLCKIVLNSSDKFIQQWPTTQVLGTSSVITLEGPRHGVIKSLILNFINRPNSLAWIVPRIQPSIVSALQSWSQKSEIKTYYQLKKVTLDYTMRYIARLEVGSHIDVIEKLFEGIVKGFRAPPWNIPGTTYYHAVKCRKKIFKMFKEELEKKKQKKSCDDIEDNIPSDLMDSLIQMKDEDGRYLSDEEVLDNVVSTIAVGHISIAYAVSWSLYFLAKSPHVLQRLREENKAILKEKNNESITYEDISKLKFTNKVVEETLRLANLSAFIFRKATDDFIYKGYIIPKGWSVIIWLRDLHLNPSNFEDPMSFNPDRWNTRPKLETYHPFGGGSRSCPGSMLVRVSMALFLHHLSIGYKWELLNPSAKVKYLSHPLPSEGLKISIWKI